MVSCTEYIHVAENEAEEKEVVRSLSAREEERKKENRVEAL